MKPGLVLERSAQVYGLMAAFFFLSSGLAYLILGQAMVTSQDFWRIYDTCLNRTWLYSTTLKYNGHSHIFPSQFWFTTLHFFHGNENIIFFIGLTLQLAGAGLLFVPVCLDSGLGKTEKVAALLVITLATFWLARSAITGIPGFNCENSLALGGAALAFLCLPALRQKGDFRSFVIVICGGMIATFSFGTGLATWPALLLLGYCLRLSARQLFILGVAATAAAIIFASLPAREPGGDYWRGFDLSLPSTYLGLAANFCRLLGSPLYHAMDAWSSTPGSAADDLKRWSLCAGVVGLVSALVVILTGLITRNLKGGCARTGYALTCFGLITFVLVIIGRAPRMRQFPAELDAPRYLYWSTLFWAGLALSALRSIKTRPTLRWPVLFAIFLLPVLIFRSHYYEGLRGRYAMVLSQAAATSLINDVHDAATIQLIAVDSIDFVYHLAPQLRQLRLNMFSAGLQDWIGGNISGLFPRRRKQNFTARCHVEALIPSEHGSPAARIRGHCKIKKRSEPIVMIISDPDGKVCGIARAYPTKAIFNKLLYGGRFASASLYGYIPHYDPAVRYTLRSVLNHVLSSEKVAIPPGPTTLNLRDDTAGRYALGSSVRRRSLRAK